MQQSFFVPSHAPFLEARTTLGSVMPYAEHFHQAFCMGLILEGRTAFFLEGARHVAEEGDIVLIAPGRAHSCNPICGVARGYHMLFIDAEWVKERVAATLDMPGGVYPREPIMRDLELFNEAVALVEALRSDVHGTGDSLAALFLRLQDRHSCFVPAVSESEKAVAPLQEYLLWPEPEVWAEAVPSVSGLAKAAGLRRDSFSRSVRRRTGLPPSRYMHCLRLEKGRRMLRQGASIAEAAAASGYADQSHFHRMFVRFFSVTPGCYQGKRRSHPYNKQPA